MTADVDKENLTAWVRHYRRPGPLLYPDERIVTFLAGQFRDREANRNRKALDIGFGSGRHVSLLADYGFQVYGIDYNEEAVEAARKRFAGVDHVRELVTGRLEDPPFPEGMFDVILAWGVMFLRPLEEMKRDLRVVNRLLKPDGKMIINFRTKHNWFFGKGVPLSDDTYHLDQTAGPYSGMFYTFLDVDQARSLLEETDFNVINYERLDLWKENGTKQHSWHIFWVRKGGKA